MQVLQKIKSFFQFVGDADTYCLVRLALGNFFKDLRSEQGSITVENSKSL